jgi:6-pyruvoyltetrahydropterin/6-carboxytetrahydropterin synthase
MASKWKISKQFDFCYGHRVHNQTLNADYSIDNRCVCRHLHGHQGKVLVYLTADTLDRGMVTDFKHLNWFKKFLDDVLDHKFIIDRNDPMFRYIIPHPPTLELGWKRFEEGYEIVDPNFMKFIESESLIEVLEGFVVVDFVPTSENLSKWLFEIVQKKMRQIGIETESVQFFETPKSQSIYSEG